MTRWHACRSRWLKRQQALRDLSSGFDRFYKQSLDSRLVAGLGPGPIALTVNLALSMIADLRPTHSLATLNLDEGQVLSAWRFARQMPRPGIRARLLKRLREHIDSRGWPVPGRRMVSVPPEISLDVAKRSFMEHLLVLRKINFSRWRWLLESTIFSHSSRRTYADECWTMIKDAKTFTQSDTEEPGDTSLRGAHKDSRHWKFECRREPFEATQFLRRSLGFWHRRTGDDTPFEPSFVSQAIAACNHWTLPRSAAFRRCVDGMQKPEGGQSLIADDKARSSVWSVRTVDCIAALRKQLMDDPRRWEPVLEPRTHVIQECRDLHLELQKVLGKRVCHAKSWNENSLPYMYKH